MAETTTPRGPRPCRCSEYFTAREVEINGQPDFADVARTTCGKQVAGKQIFAAGHDAKLKSLAILAKRRGQALFREVGGVLHSGTAESMTVEYGFGRMVASAKVPTDKKAKDTKAPATKPEQPSTVWAKVGRWAYEGTVNSKTGRFTYRDRAGREHSTSNYRISDVLDTPGIQVVKQGDLDESGQPIPF